MQLRETGFTFNGQHSYSQMGFYYSEANMAHEAWPNVKRNEYGIAGMSGTVLMPGEQAQVLTFSGSLYPRVEPACQADAQKLIRRAQEWLLVGRCPLVFDYEPDVYYMAQLSKAASWSLKNWFGGQLDITFEAQPYAYAVQATEATAAVVENDAELSLPMATLWPAPLLLEITNTGARRITEARVSVNGEQVMILTGITNFATGMKLTMRSEAPAGCEMTAGTRTWSAMMRAEKFKPVALGKGANTIAVTVVYHETDTGTAGATVRASARGRW